MTKDELKMQKALGTLQTISKPMLAAKLGSFDDLDFNSHQFLATPKIDGVRAIMSHGHLVSRTFKPIRNNHIRNILEALLPDGADGEIVCPGAFQQTSSGVMSEDGSPEFLYMWFDYVEASINTPYYNRIDDLLREYSNITSELHSEVVRALIPITIKDLDHLKEYEQKCIDDGYEGVILRTKDSPYKCGRATAKQQWLLKVKRFEDSEALIIGFGEKMHNDNEATQDAFGRTVRSSHQENKRPAGTLGQLQVRDCTTGIEFEIGTGFSDEQRKEIWDNRDKWTGKIVTYRHFAVTGVKDKPRFPSYKGVRDESDI